MSALLKVIKFRSLVNTLTDKEFNRFTSYLGAKCGRDALFIVGSPFNHQNQNHSHVVNIAIGIVKCIMNSRIKSNQNLAPHAKKLDSLPNELIGEIASYLSQKHYSVFAQTNRSIYIGCNDPNTLKHLNLHEITNYASVNLQHYPNIDHLELKSSKFHQLSLPSNETILPHLTKLTLHMKSDAQINKLSLQTAISFKNVTHLELHDFNDTLDNYAKLLKLFPKVEYLINFHVTVENRNLLLSLITNPFNIKTLSPNLKGYCHFSSSPMILDTVIRSCSSSLKCLHFTYGPRYVVSFPPNLSLPKLEELSISRPTTDILNIFSNATPSLERLELNNITSNMDKSQIKNILNKLLLSHKSLEFLEVIDVELGKLDSICEGIETGLYYLEEQRGGDLKIRIQIGKTKKAIIPKSADLFLRTSRVTTQLESAGFDNWMMRVLVVGDITPDEEWKDRRKAFKKKYEERFTQHVHVSKEQMYLILSNVGCKISGCGKSKWMLYW